MKDWSPIKNNQVLDIIHDVFTRAKSDGAFLLDPLLEVFQSILAEQPMFREYLENTSTYEAVLSPDGRTRHLWYKLALQEALNPADPTNQATREKTIEYLQVQCGAALEKMEDPKLALANKLTSQDGCNAIGKQSKAVIELAGCHATNDAMAESVFGAYKYERRRLPGISQRRASGLAQSRLMKSLSHADAICHRSARRSTMEKKKKARRAAGEAFGYFHRLPHTEAVALVELARVNRAKERALDRADHEELDAFRSARRKTNSQLELESLIKQFALGLSFFDRFKVSGQFMCMIVLA